MRDPAEELAALQRHLAVLESGGVRFTYTPEEFEVFGRGDDTEPYLERLRARIDELTAQLGKKA